MGVRFGAAGAAAMILVAAAMIPGAGAATAHDMGQVPDTPAGHAVAARHQNFKQLGGAFKAIMDELKKPAPDTAVLAANAQKMNQLAAQEARWFPPGSGPESGVKTGAKAEIWSDPAGFAAAVQRLQAAAGKLQQVSAGGDLDAVKLAVRDTGMACKACHDKYRVPDQH